MSCGSFTQVIASTSTDFWSFLNDLDWLTFLNSFTVLILVSFDSFKVEVELLLEVTILLLNTLRPQQRTDVEAKMILVLLFHAL